MTDVARNTHVAAERYSRGAAGLAGAQGAPFHVFVEDWDVAGASAEAVHITARNGDFAIDLDLIDSKRVVAQGDHGLSQKSAGVGNASYYYSMPRMATRGRVSTPEGVYRVSGDSWLDREWSTSSLDEQTAGWDWFALQLDDQREIMFYQLRLKDGARAPVSGGTLIAPDGTPLHLGARDFEFTTTGTWRSPESGVALSAGLGDRVARA